MGRGVKKHISSQCFVTHISRATKSGKRLTRQQRYQRHAKQNTGTQGYISGKAPFPQQFETSDGERALRRSVVKIDASSVSKKRHAGSTTQPFTANKPISCSPSCLAICYPSTQHFYNQALQPFNKVFCT